MVYVTNAQIYFLVSPQGSVSLQPSGNILTAANSKVTLTCLADGGPNNVFEWRRQGVVISNDPVLLIPMVTGSDGGVYRCTVSNAAGSDTATTTVIVSPQGSVSVSPPGNILTAVNIKVTLTCIAQGGPNNMFKWRRQGVVISNDPVLSIPMVTGSDGGVYQCTVSNDAGSDTATTTIIVSPSGTVVVTPKHLAVDHLTHSVIFTCQSDGGPNLMYTWLYNDATPNNDDIVINGNQLTVNRVTYLLGGTYTCIVSNEAGEGRDSSDLFVNPVIIIHPVSQSAQVGQTVTFNCVAGAYPSPSYSWSTPDTNIFVTSSIMISTTYSSFGNYTCTASSNGVVVISDTAVLTVSPQGSVSVRPVGNILTSVDSTVSSTCVAQGGPNNVFEWRRQGVVISNDPVLSISMVTGSDGGVYQCTVSNAAGSDTATTTITVAPFNATITEVVVINMVTYTCYADGGPGKTYEWLRLRDNSVVSSTQELILDNTDPLDGGNYQCTITNNAGDTIIIGTLNVAPVIMESPQTQNVTAGQSFMLTCNATGYPVPTIEWRQNGTSCTVRDTSVITITPTDGLRSNSSVITVTNATTSDTGLYQCVATNVVGSDMENATVVVQAPGFTVDLQTEFTLFNDTIGSYVITWTPPSLDNGSYYQILYYSFSSAYTIGPLYNGSSSIMLDQGQGSYNVSNALYYTNYAITITTVNMKYNISNGPVEIMDQTPSAVPTAVHDLTAVASSTKWIYISWNHPKYPNSQLTQYLVYYRRNPPMIQMSPNISHDGFVAVDVPTNTLSLNLSGLNTFTNYSIHMSVRGEGVSNAPIEKEIIARTNSSGR
ncbi:hemicentin-1-like isoform X3 [Dysidea avara]|uniref:hemicentin-1-like isoform X3 n=1 Tax=Dysidea avara TaxID=196820 RepID=UPI0033237E4A